MIQFNKPTITGEEGKYLLEVVEKGKFSGDGEFTKLCNQWLQNNLPCKKALLTTSCTHALEMCAILLDIKACDEIIMPSFTFVTTASAFVLRGGRIVFVDVNPSTMNIDEKLIVPAITEKTKAIVVVHYAGVSCNMKEIMDIAEKYNLIVIEDAAQAIMSKYRGRHLGTIGNLGCFSFHETKNIQCGEGGALIINDMRFIERSEIIREKGTNRAKFIRGEIDKYGWVDIGSSYLPSELNAAFLYPQLVNSQVITDQRLASWETYYKGLYELSVSGRLELPKIPDDCRHNGHLFYIKTADLAERGELIQHLRSREIQSVFHYIPLHTSLAGMEHGKLFMEDRWTTVESERLLRLPLYYGISRNEIEYIVSSINDYYN